MRKETVPVAGLGLMSRRSWLRTSRMALVAGFQGSLDGTPVIHRGAGERRTNDAWRLGVGVARSLPTETSPDP